MNRSNHYSVIVIGVGSMGAAACYYLARRGVSVLGLEQFDLVHDRGSHAGQSRIIRKAYFEHPDYVPLLKHAYQNWQSLEQETNARVYYPTGIVYFGKPELATLKGIRKSASLYNIPVESLEQGQVSERFPQFKIPSGFEALFEPDAGFITPERAVHLYTQEAIKNGAVIKTQSSVKDWKQVGGIISITTASGEYTCEKLIVTAGAWTSKLIPHLKTELKVTQQLLAWVRPKNREIFSLENFPCWFVEDPQRGVFYGFPFLSSDRFDGPAGLKLAHHFPGELWDADNVSTAVSKGAEDTVRYALGKYLPEAGDEIVSFKHCLYTYSQDENFIIDHLPGYDKRVTVACGFSGHGFKFVSVVGEILADMAVDGKSELPIDFLSLKRLRKNNSGC
jgi:sarcosine oxidase